MNAELVTYRVLMDDASLQDGNVIMITTVAMWVLLMNRTVVSNSFINYARLLKNVSNVIDFKQLLCLLSDFKSIVLSTVPDFEQLRV